MLKIWGRLAPKIWGDRPELSFQRFGSASPTFGQSWIFEIGFAFSLILHLAQILETWFPEVGQASPKFWAPRPPKRWGRALAQMLGTGASPNFGRAAFPIVWHRAFHNFGDRESFELRN